EEEIALSSYQQGCLEPNCILAYGCIAFNGPSNGETESACLDTDRDGKITGEQAWNLFLSWRLPRVASVFPDHEFYISLYFLEVLKQVWDLSDQDNDSMLSLREFCIALYLIERHSEGRALPGVLPSNILLALLPSGLPATQYSFVTWGNPS
ncbi:hypothetical protein S83_008485, partial [Arachis hypogaea]